MGEVVQPSTLLPGPLSALLRREEGILCEVHLKRICGVTQVEPCLDGHSIWRAMAPSKDMSTRPTMTCFSSLHTH